LTPSLTSTSVPFQRAMIEVGHQTSSAKTPCAALPSLRLRSIANK
jgi:hypothetical protein